LAAIAVTSARFASTRTATRSSAKTTKANTATKAKSTVKKKPVATRRPTAKKTTATKKKTTAAKKKPVKKAAKKPVAKKPVVKKRAKKELTEEQKLRKEIRQLREKALDPPSRGTRSAWSLFSSEKGGISAAIADEWKALPEDKKKEYAARAQAAYEAKRKAFESWVSSKSAAEIYEANKARARLGRLRCKTKTTQIPDPRAHKRPVSASVLHMMDQYKSGRKFVGADGKKMPVTDIMKTCREEYTKLPEAEKKKYEARAQAGKEEYFKYMKATMGEAYTPPKGYKVKNT